MSPPGVIIAVPPVGDNPFYATRPVRVVILSAGLVFAKGASLGHFELLAPGALSSWPRFGAAENEPAGARSDAAEPRRACRRKDRIAIRSRFGSGAGCSEARSRARCP